jgi:hypothetical protein
MQDQQTPPSNPREKTNWIFYALMRWTIAFIILFYGFAKLAGAQFTILNSELDKPMGHVSGFWLVWYFFGYSKIYGTFIALAQIFGAILLTFRKTALLGACILFPIAFNIALVDIFYRIEPAATFAALLVLFGLSILLLMHAQELIDFFWRRQNRLFPPVARRFASTKWIVRLALILITASVAYWTANYNNRKPTVLDGVWDVVQARVPNTSPEVPSTIFFERNRAGLCVFKFPNGTYRSNNFEVDEKSRILRIWQDRSRQGLAIFEGHYELSPQNLYLEGRFSKDDHPVTINLQKRD